jgi:hypothetical protein
LIAASLVEIRAWVLAASDSMKKTRMSIPWESPKIVGAVVMNATSISSPCNAASIVGPDMNLEYAAANPAFSNIR